MDIFNPITKLSRSRKIFHSEADFQFALAWEIQKEYPDAKIRLEYCPPGNDLKQYIDIMVVTETGWYPIELKYKTRSLSINYDGELFRLKDQSAQDQGRYDFLKDVQRIESFCKYNPEMHKGFAVFLTNDSAYWNGSKGNNTVYEEYKLIDGSIKTGTMSWAKHASGKTIEGRESPIILEQKYLIEWQDYSKFVNSRYGTFKYLVLSNRDNILDKHHFLSDECLSGEAAFSV